MFLKELLVAKETDALFHNFVDDAIITPFKNITYVNKNCAHVKMLKIKLVCVKDI